MLPKEERKVLVIVLIFLAKLQSWITPLFIKKKKKKKGFVWSRVKGQKGSEPLTLTGVILRIAFWAASSPGLVEGFVSLLVNLHVDPL